MGDAPGFYGKAVTRGDFLSRRLPGDFAKSWDGFLQAMVGASQEELGAFMTMPVWHFALGGGIAGPGPMLGVLIPSVDRVGRYFPFSILGFCAAGGLDAEGWAAQAEQLALGALADGFDPAELDAALKALGPPAPLAAAALPPAGESLWWCRGSAAGTLRAEGLPNARESRRLVHGISS